MSLTNCKKCGTLFSKIEMPFCPDCMKKEEAEFERAAQWLRENSGKSVDIMSRETGIPKRDILKWIREKRLMMSIESEHVRCTKCGRPIETGKFCDHCKLGLRHILSEGLEAIRREKEAMAKPQGMHYRPEERKRGGGRF